MALILQLKVSEEDLAAIGHVVIDPHEWVKHAFENVGAAAVRAKIEKCAAEYEAARKELGADYKTRAERHDEEQAAEAERLREAALERDAEATRRFNELVSQAVARELAARGS